MPHSVNIKLSMSREIVCGELIKPNVMIGVPRFSLIERSGDRLINILRTSALSPVGESAILLSRVNAPTINAMRLINPKLYSSA